jgi:pyruvate/2-oxoglutarate dehydrogenase complex dihydrolipoamide acyltransferase (E2) component
MSSTSEKHEVVPFPKERRTATDLRFIARYVHPMTGLVEIDVTEARRLIREHEERTGEAISFTGFIVACVGKAVAADRSVHAYRNGSGELVIFDDVDIGTMIERKRNGKRFPLGYVVRAADKKSVYDIHREIRAVQNNQVEDPGMRTLSLASSMPGFARRLYIRYALRRPHLLKRFMGTVIVTAIGMFVGHSGWGLTTPTNSLSLVIGGIGRKPGVVDGLNGLDGPNGPDGHIAIREYLCVTIAFNHEVIDGAPAARFTECFIDLVEGAYGLHDLPKV